MQINLDKRKKKKLIIIISSILVALIIVSIAFYIGNKSFRTFFDRYILGKEITENKATSIDISDQENPSIYAFDQYITILNKNKLNLYSASGKKEYELEVNISDALYASNNHFLMIAQKNGQNLYQISEGNIVWQKEIEGQIQKVNVNKNGYVSIIIAGSSYKTVIATYSPQGKELFKTYLSSTTCIDTTISADNKYLAIAEINTSGTLIQSSIKVISVEKAQTDPTNSVINTYNAESDQLIKNIEYQDKNYLVAMYDNEIKSIYKEQNEQIVSFTNDKITFANIKLNNYAVYTLEKSSGLFNSNTQVSLKNITTEKENIYVAEGIAKDIKTHANHIALNLGSEIHFITTNGWLTKKYTSEKEVKDIVLGEKLAGVVYKDKIDIINL
ncbi:MAG: hypothetical protein J6A04_07540 [Clostridia bacterium]|nr:hypothetical protein [Clostridia bacterium]